MMLFNYLTVSICMFLFIFLLYLAILFYQTFEKAKQNDSNFLLFLDKYYISNIKYDLFLLSLYFFFSVVIFIIYRITLFNRITYIEIFDTMTLNIPIILNVISFLLSILYYFKILNLLFEEYLMKIHFYFCKYLWYNKLNDFEREHYQWVSHKLRDCASFLRRNTYSKEFFIKLFNVERFDKPENVYKSKEYAIWEKMQNRKGLLYLYKMLSIIFDTLARWTSLFLYYLLYSVMAIILVYDIFQGKLYFIYYMLVIYFILKFIRKMRNFIQVKDPVYDDIIMRHFYKNEIPYAKIRESFTNKKKSQRLTHDVSYHQTDIRNYFENDFQVHYIVDPHMTKNRKRNHNFAKRLNIIFLLICAVIFNVIYDKYFIIIGSYEMGLNIVLIPAIIILFCSNLIIFYYPITREKALEYKPCVWLFRIVFCITILPILYVILKNKITIMSQEVLFSFDSFKIIESFSIEEYIDYLVRYFSFLQRTIPLEVDIADDMILQAKKSIKESDNVSMEYIRKIVKNLLVSKKIKIISLKNIWQKIRQFFGHG